MDAEIKAKWVAALRSGDYKQTDGQLCTSTHSAFCCLGVLCDVIDPKGWKDTYHHKLVSKAVGAGPDSTQPLRRTLVPADTQRILADMNDQGHSFSEIADYIDKNL